MKPASHPFLKSIALGLTLVGTFSLNCFATDWEIKPLDTPLSLLSGGDMGGDGTAVRIEDYVSNPPPGTSDSVMGALVKVLPGDMTAFVEPTAELTAKDPLPDPVGVIVSTSESKIRIGSLTSAGPTADIVSPVSTGEKWVEFRFVNPKDKDAPAAVTRVAFGLAGQQILDQTLEVMLFDVDGNEIYRAPVPAGQGMKGIAAYLGYESFKDGKPAPGIHRVRVVSQVAVYWCLGSYPLSEKHYDIVYDGVSMGGKPQATARFGFDRPLNFKLFPTDARQWQKYNESVMITDLSKVEPASALTTGKRQFGKWKVVDYATEEFSGKALSVYPKNEAPVVKLPLNVTGWYAVYIGVNTVSGGLDRAQPNGVKAKLSSEKVFRHMANNMKLIAPRRDVLQEEFLTVANLKPGEGVDFGSQPWLPGTLMYVRLVPITEPELAAWNKDLAKKEFRTAIVTFDGHSWIWPYRPRTAEDLEANFEGFQYTDTGKWWFQVMGADLVCYPSKIGTIAGADTEVFAGWQHGEFPSSIKALIANGVNPLVVARNAAKKQGTEFHVFIRPQGWGASMPWEETFDSKFFKDHPEWRCVDWTGKHTLHMSWAVPEVRAQMKAIFKEAIEMCDPDGVGFLFNRGMPLMLFEPAFADRFKKEYGTDVKSGMEEDPKVLALRAKIVNEFFQEIRTMLDEMGKSKGKRYQISAATFADEQFNKRFGLDLPTWIKSGLVDELAPAFHTHYTKYQKPNMEYYQKLVKGSKVQLAPFVVAWHVPKAVDLCKEVMNYYDRGASNIAVWDFQTEAGYKGGEGNFIDLGGYLGHRELIDYWMKNGVPVPHSYPLTRLGENEYSEWFPNVGY